MGIFKSNKPPLCRCCGKAIPKHTMHFYVVTELTDLQRANNERHAGDTFYTRYIEVPSLPKTKAELMRFSNAIITSVKYTRIKDHWDDAEWKEQYISEFTSWDGESYRDKYFCNRTRCAVRFAYTVAEKTTVKTVAYSDALTRQRKERVA